MQFDKGWISPYFITDPKEQTAELENPYILLHEKKLSNLRDLTPILELSYRESRPLLIIAEDLEGDALAGLVVNKLRGVLKVVAVKAPGFGNRRKAILEDIAILTGGQLIAEESGVKLENVESSWFGTAKKIVVDKNNTTIIEGAGEKKALDDRAKQIRTQIDQTSSNYDKEKLQERLAKLTGGVAQIRVGGPTEPQMKELKYRVDDALAATKAAVEEGVSVGGGAPYIQAAKKLDGLTTDPDELLGVGIVKRALEVPARQIADNAHFDGQVVVAELKASSDTKLGFNGLTGKHENLVESGIIDPTKVLRIALQNAASIAGLALTTETMVCEKKDKKEAVTGSVT
jgi:chaperonin GroEL